MSTEIHGCKNDRKLIILEFKMKSNYYNALTGNIHILEVKLSFLHFGNT